MSEVIRSQTFAKIKKEVGDVVEVSTPGGVKEVEILEIKLI